MLVTLTNTDGITLEMPADVVFQGTFTRNWSTALVHVRRDTNAWDESYFDPMGGMLVEIDTGRGRVFRGIADIPDIDDIGATLTVHHITQWFEIRRVAAHREFLGATAGMIALWAVRDGCLGLGAMPITIGPIAHGAPHVDHFLFTGQTVFQVLTELTELTGQEWYIDDRMRFYWQARQGRFREIIVSDNGDFAVGVGSLSDLAREVIEVQPDGREWRLTNYRVPARWPRQDVVRP